ncbi:four-carbon acid sugar kinase family protein [Bosea sp. PAMC 26642]|uniref:four-carbon acid sugar kinase family protein n=1 Tax=Bosea sp. (strain PAMC 26642) TaxID=1792307 RepID=UPI00076FFFE7|nr:four-carbon acid sugar kinase family protein [Bosea sp. PAMC 26642]AMJ63188.1 hypothetical protein AXW83_25380 [Bosea sp. PAMC 26642]
MARVPLYGWYGDDFTGATDTLATLVEGGLRALLFLGLPTPAHLAAAGPLDAIGVAGATRAMAPDAMTAELDPAGAFFAAQGVALMHYKCCSTFDSAPGTGSLGAAIRALRRHFPQGPVPIVGGQPNLRRYCLFGQLFAAAGIGGAVHRIDRHPTMSVHPVTPMHEADLRRHLAGQGVGPIELLDYRAYDGSVEALWVEKFASGPEAVLLDVSRQADIAVVGRLLTQQLAAGALLAVGPSSVAQAFLAGSMVDVSGRTAVVAATPRRDGPVLTLVGSLSPVTREQVEAASGYHKLAIDPGRLGDAGYRNDLLDATISHLGTGDVMLITDRPDGAPQDAASVAAATAALLRAIVERVTLSRLIVAGGDTSSQAIQALDIWGLGYRAACVPGAPLCRVHSDLPQLDGLDIILKGGQMGPPDFFDVAARQ